MNSNTEDTSSGHYLKTRAEQERISAFLHENSRRSTSEESRSQRQGSSRSRTHRHRHPLDPVESDSDSDRRNRHRTRGKQRRSHSRSSSSENERRRRHKYDDTNQRRNRRRSSESSTRSSMTRSRSRSRDRKRRDSREKSAPKPTNTVIMHHIPLTFDEHQLLSELSIAKVPVQQVRIARRRDPAINLQTAYIDFNTVHEAEQWIHSTQVQTIDFTIQSFLFLSIGGNVVCNTWTAVIDRHTFI